MPDLKKCPFMMVMEVPFELMRRFGRNNVFFYIGVNGLTCSAGFEMKTRIIVQILLS